MSASGGGSKPDDMGIAIVAGGLVIGTLVWVFWTLFHVQVLDTIRWIKVYELLLIGIFNHNAKGASDTLAMFPSRMLSVPLVLQATEIVTSYIRWPIVAAFFALAAIRWKTAPQLRFRRRFNLESLIQEQGKMWKVISPIVNFNPSKTSARIPGEAVPAQLPPFAESLSPEEWIAWARIPIVSGQPDRESMRRALVRQLGIPWTGIKCLTQPQRALFAAFALKGAQKRAESDTLLSDISGCWSLEQGLVLTSQILSRIDHILSDSKIVNGALEIAKQYGWRTTALVGVLKWAREQGGVLAPAQFLWLRAEERTLWYPLNNIGRKSYHAEAAGAMAHYMAESNAGRPLLIPRVETAIVTITQYMVGDTRPVVPPLAESGQPTRSINPVTKLLSFKSS